VHDAEQVNKQPGRALSVRHLVTHEKSFWRAHDPKIDVDRDIASRRKLGLQIPQGMGLARPPTAIQHLMVDRLDRGGYARIHKRLSELIHLALLGPLRDKVQRAIDRRQSCRHGQSLVG